MKRRQAVNITACLLASSIVSGYLLPWWCLVVIVIPIPVFFAVYEKARGRNRRTGSTLHRPVWRDHRRRWMFRVAVAALIVCSGWLYGSVRSAAEPGSPSAEWLGIPIELDAQIVSLFPAAHATDVYLDVRHLQAASAAARFRFMVRWQTRLSAHSLHKGESVLLAGVLMHASPVRSHGPKSGQPHMQTVPFELSGRLLRTTPTKETWADVLQTNTLDAIARIHIMDDSSARLAYSLVFGGPAFDTATKQMFLEAGLLHVLAASGANLMILEAAVSALVLPLLRWLRLPASLQSALLVALIWLFTAVCRFDVSVVRAASMSTYRLLGQSVGRSPTVMTALLVTFLLYAVWDPASMLSVSAVLSFAATAAIAVALSGHQRMAEGARWTRKAIRRLLQKLWSVIRTTLYVELFLIPVTVVTFRQITPYSIVSNILADPLLGILLPVTAAWICMVWLLSYVPALTGLVLAAGWLVAHLLSWLRWWTGWVSAWPGALLALPVLDAWVFIPYCLGFLILVATKHDRRMSSDA